MSEVGPLTDDDLKSVANYVAEQEEGLHGLPLVLGNGTPINRLLATIEAYKAEVEELKDKVDGLECDLASAVDIVRRRGDAKAVIWADLNYPRALKTTPTGGE